jgi:hypothetical protein
MDDFSSLFQLVKYFSTDQKALRPCHFGCALELVINAVIRKYTDPQADSKAENSWIPMADPPPHPVRGLQDWARQEPLDSPPLP